MSSISQHFSTYSKALDLRAQRHQVLASNIANADTPNYKARDFDFQVAMQNATAARPGGAGLKMATTSSGHLSDCSGAAGMDLKFRKETQSAVDGNTVDMDVERAQIADNALQYQILTQLIGEKFRGLKSALAGTQG